MTSVQVLDGLVDTAIRDDQGRLHGTVVYQGDRYYWGKGYWTARVNYDHGVPQSPVDWLTPEGWILRRSWSFRFVDDHVLPNGWTRNYAKAEGGWTDNWRIESEGVWNAQKFPTLSYDHNLKKQYRNGKDGKIDNSPITIPPPPPDLWPEQWPIPASPAAS